MLRLCIPHRTLNSSIRLFKLSFQKCEDAVINIDKARHRMPLDMDSWYFNILIHPSSKTNIAFFRVN